MSCHGCLMSVRKLEGTERYSDYADKCPAVSCNLTLTPSSSQMHGVVLVMDDSLIEPQHPAASRVFLSLAPFWCTPERLCIRQRRSLLSMRCMLLVYSFEPRANSPALSTAHFLFNKRMLAL